MKKRGVLCIIVLAVLLIGCGNSEEKHKSNQEKNYEKEFEAKQENQDVEKQQSDEKANSELPNQETNYLKQLDIVPIPVEANAGTDKSKYYAFVRANIELIKGLSEQEYLEFCNDCIKNSGYRYFTIDFQNGTGIVFPNCYTEAGIYGEIEETRSIINAKKYIGIDENGKLVLTNPTTEY